MGGCFISKAHLEGPNSILYTLSLTLKAQISKQCIKVHNSCPGTSSICNYFRLNWEKYLFFCRNLNFLKCLEFRLGLWLHELRLATAFRCWLQNRKIHTEQIAQSQETITLSCLIMYYNKKHLRFSFANVYWVLNSQGTLKSVKLSRCVTVCSICTLEFALNPIKLNGECVWDFWKHIDCWDVEDFLKQK